MALEKALFIIFNSRGLGINVLVNGVTSYEHWENRCTSSLVKSNACIFSISVIVLGWCCSCYIISDYSRIGSSQSLWVSQLHNPDVQPLAWSSPAMTAGYHFLFSFFSQQMWLHCASPTLFIFTPFSCNNRKLTHCSMFWCGRGTNYTQRCCFSCLCCFTFFDLSEFSLDLDRLRRIMFKMHANPTSATVQIQHSSLVFR